MREAIKALEMIRVLDVRRGDGTYVTSLEPRLLLEPAAVALATPRMSESTIAEGLVAHDFKFHGKIVVAAGNSYLARLIDSLANHTVRARIWRGLTQALATMHISGVEQWLREAIEGT